jgi:inner membrane protein
MNPITHILTGWCLAEAFPDLSRREQGLVTLAAVAPDLDGLGLVAELATRDTAHPLLWWTEYHHVLGHNFLFACVATLFARRLLTGALVFLAVHLHILGDLAGSRGPDDYQWPIPYLWPFSDSPQLAWSGQWYLNAWPNIVLTIALLAMTFYLAWRRG